MKKKLFWVSFSECFYASVHDSRDRMCTRICCWHEYHQLPSRRLATTDDGLPPCRSTAINIESPDVIWNPFECRSGAIRQAKWLLTFHSPAFFNCRLLDLQFALLFTSENPSPNDLVFPTKKKGLRFKNVPFSSRLLFYC